MKKASLFAIIVALTALLGAGFAQAATISYKGADASPALRVFNTYTGTVSVVITTNGAGDNMSVTLDGLANAVDGSGDTDTIAELKAVILACTNRAGLAKLVVDSDCALAADSTDGELLDGTYTATAGKWLEIPWDTSAALHYDVYIPDNKADKTRLSRTTISSVAGSVTGTGAGTLSVYIDGTLAWQKVCAETSALHPTSGVVTVVSSVLNLPVDVGVPVGAEQAAIVRMSRATTATTGILSVITE